MGVVLWFTGLSGSGKTTIAKMLEAELKKRDRSVFIFDGDVIRNTRNKNLGFSRGDIRKNNRFIAGLARKRKEHYDAVLVPVISPFRKDRATARNIIGDNFFEVFINCPLSVCEKRDVKGLYKKARDGEIENFIGLSELSPYEKPLKPDIIIRTNRTTEKGSVRILLKELIKRGHI